MLNLFKRFKSGLSETRQAITQRLTSIFLGNNFSVADWAKLEEELYKADFGSVTVAQLMHSLKSLKSSNTTPTDALRRTLLGLLDGAEGDVSFVSNGTVDNPLPQVVMLLGVNGAGKTTTAAKIAHYWKQQNHKVLLGSCDTFRAAANQQLKSWADRLQLDCIGSQQGADAAAVAFDVCQAGLHRGYERIILDTAGRLHNKSALLEEIKKMVRVLQKCNPAFPQHRWLVIDGSLGTNSLQQAQVFNEAIPLTGLIVTKLDGTSKGGTLVSIFNTLHIPIYFVGLGEQAEDLQPFSLNAYIEGLLTQTP